MIGSGSVWPAATFRYLSALVALETIGLRDLQVSDRIVSWLRCSENVVNNINSVTPYLTQADASIPPRSRPGGWAYPDSAFLPTSSRACLRRIFAGLAGSRVAIL